MELEVGDEDAWLTSLNVEGVKQFGEILVGSSTGFIVMVNGTFHGSMKQWVRSGCVTQYGESELYAHVNK